MIMTDTIEIELKKGSYEYLIMKNIFENAYFGKPYKTRDGSKAIYQKDSKAGLYHHWLITDSSCFACANSGEQNMKVEKSPLDIVSEWQEPINEEELDKLALKNYPDDDDDDTPLYGIDKTE